MIAGIIAFILIFALCCAFEYIVHTMTYHGHQRFRPISKRLLWFEEETARRDLYPRRLYPELYPVRNIRLMKAPPLEDILGIKKCELLELTPDEFMKVVEGRKHRFFAEEANGSGDFVDALRYPGPEVRGNPLNVQTRPVSQPNAQREISPRSLGSPEKK